MIYLLRLYSSSRKRVYKGNPKNVYKNVDEASNVVKSRLEIVRESDYQAKTVLNHLERKVYWNVINYLNSKYKEHRYLLLSQVSCAEIVKASENEDAWKPLYGKRVDFCILNREYKAIAIIEIQGSGHYIDEDAHERDEIKRIAFAKANIPIRRIEISNMDDSSIKNIVEANIAEILQ